MEHNNIANQGQESSRSYFTIKNSALRIGEKRKIVKTKKKKNSLKVEHLANFYLITGMFCTKEDFPELYYSLTEKLLNVHASIWVRQRVTTNYTEQHQLRLCTFDATF